MKLTKSFTLMYRRKREGKTDYRARLKLLSSQKFRVVVRKMLNNYYVQIVNYAPEGDKVLVSSNTRELLKYGWKVHRGNLCSGYLVGFLCGKKAKNKGIGTGILDLGFHRVVKGSGVFAVVKGLRDAGFEISVSQKVLPPDERISGKHIEDYAKSFKDRDLYNRRFSKYLSIGIKPEDVSKYFEEVKKKISEEKW